MKGKVFAVLSVGMLVSSAALADQCEWLTQEQAHKAHSFVKEGDKILSYCEPCDSQPKLITVTNPQDVEVKKGLKNSPTFPTSHYELQFGPQDTKTSAAGKADPRDAKNKTMHKAQIQDLAYLFVPKDGRYINLASLAGCPTKDVSKSVKFAPGKGVSEKEKGE